MATRLVRELTAAKRQLEVVEQHVKLSLKREPQNGELYDIGKNVERLIATLSSIIVDAERSFWRSP